MNLGFKKVVFFFSIIFLAIGMPEISRAFSLPASDYDVLVGLDLPVFYQFNKAEDDSRLKSSESPSGALILAQIKYRFGLGVDLYVLGIEDSKGNTEHSIQVRMINLTYMIPIQKVELTFGGGYGVAEVNGPNKSDFDKGTPYQILGRFGVWVRKNLMINVSYRHIWNEISYKGSDYALEAGGGLAGVGVSVKY